MSARRQIIAALSEDSHGGIATLADVDHAEQLVDAHRAEILAADGQAYDGELAMYRTLVRTLRVVVREDDSVSEVRRLLHQHVLDDIAARAGDIEKATASAAPATPFFQVGHTYTEPDGSTDWKFRCDAITTRPDTGRRTALGWRHFRGEWSECAYGEDDWEIHQIADHIDASEAGDHRG